ncbi:MAG: hypothetical protein AAGA35_00640 [Patescibacteria group bacterium]
MDKKTIEDLIEEAGFSEAEKHALLQKLAEALTGKMVMMLEERAPQEQQEAWSRLELEAKIQHILEYAKTQVSPEEKAEIGTAAKETILTQFSEEIITPRLQPDS